MAENSNIEFNGRDSGGRDIGDKDRESHKQDARPFDDHGTDKPDLGACDSENQDVDSFDAILTGLDAQIEAHRQAKDDVTAALKAIPSALPGANLEEVAEKAADKLEKRHADFISRLEKMRGDVAEKVDFAKWRYELGDLDDEPIEPYEEGGPDDESGEGSAFFK